MCYSVDGTTKSFANKMLNENINCEMTASIPNITLQTTLVKKNIIRTLININIDDFSEPTQYFQLLWFSFVCQADD